MPAPIGPRATGPYRKARDGRATLWIVAVHGTDGRRVDAAYPSEAEAVRVRDDFNAENKREAAATIEQAMTAYFEAKRGSGCKESTLTTTRYRLTAFFGDMSMPVADVTQRLAVKLYEKRSKAKKVDPKTGKKVPAVRADTHLNELAETRRFLKWCARKRYIKTSPLADFELEDKPQRAKGKAQLHADEARKFLRHAFASYDGGRLSALGSLCALLLSARCSEIVGLRVRDVDDGGKLIWFAEEDGKTDAARRVVKAPDLLASRLAALAKDRDGSEPLWGGHVFERHWPLKATKRLCAEAGVPVITAHGLRGTLVTLARAEGASMLDLAKMLGHEGTAVTERHYAAPGTDAAATRDAGFRVLQGGKAG